MSDSGYIDQVILKNGNDVKTIDSSKYEIIFSYDNAGWTPRYEIDSKYNTFLIYDSFYPSDKYKSWKQREGEKE